MTAYDKPPELYDGLRLHQNENTGGCSPRVLEALAKLRPDEVGFYPPYAAATRACARYLGVDPDALALTNGLDEGIMGLAVAYLRPPVGGPVPEALVPEPAFEIFRVDTEVVGGRFVQVMPKPDFTFALDEVLAAITPRTRVVFLTNPNNPTGVSMPLDAIRAVARHVPREAVVLVDEAYVEFAGTTFISELPAFPNVIVGRTFSKAFGLAGLRIGCLVGATPPISATTSGRCRSRRPCCTPPAIASDSSTGRATQILFSSAPAIGCARSSKAPPIAAFTSATARPSPAAPAVSASPRASLSTRAAS